MIFLMDLIFLIVANLRFVYVFNHENPDSQRMFRGSYKLPRSTVFYALTFLGRLRTSSC